MNMSPKERILMLRLYEKVSENKGYAEKIGIEIAFNYESEIKNNTRIKKS